MASPIQYILTQYKSKAGWFIKAYEPSTNTPKPIYFEAQELTSADKVIVNANGFPENPNTLEADILYVADSFDLYLFEVESEADANDFTNAIKIADNVNAGKDTVSLNIPNADKETYGLVRIATQAEAEEETPVNENLILSPKKLDKIAVDNMQNLKATPTDVDNLVDTKWMTASNYDDLFDGYTPPIATKEYEVGDTYFKHISEITTSELIQDGSVFNHLQYPDLSILPDYRQGSLELIGVTQDVKTQQIDTSDVEASNIKFLKVGLQRWFGVVRYNGENLFCESSNLKNWTLYTNPINSGFDITDCSLAYDSDNNIVAVLDVNKNFSGVGAMSLFVTSAYLDDTGISFVDNYRNWKTYNGISGNPITSASSVEFSYNTSLQRFVGIHQTLEDNGRKRMYFLTTADFVNSDENKFYEESNIAVPPTEIVKTFDENDYVTIDERTNTRYKDGKYYLIGTQTATDTKTLFSIDESNPVLVIEDTFTPTLTPVNNYNNAIISDEGVYVCVIGYDSATGRYELLTSNDLDSFSTVIYDSGFTNLSADCYCVPIKNYWLFKTGLATDFNTSYTRDFITEDLLTTFTGIGSGLNMFASYIETTNTFIEFTGAGTDGYIYTLENQGTIDFQYKTIKMSGAPAEGGKTVDGFSNPTKTSFVDTNRSSGSLIYIKISDNLIYGMIAENLIDTGAYNVFKSTDNMQTIQVLPQSQTGAHSRTVNITTMTWNGGDYILVSGTDSTVSVFQISTETFTSLNVNMFSGSPSISGTGFIRHYNENLGKFIMFQNRDDFDTLYVVEFENDPTNRTATNVTATGLNFDFGSGIKTPYETSYYNGKYYIFDMNTKSLYSITESDWILTLEYTFTPSLSTTYGTGQSLTLKPLINKDGKLAFILSWDNTTKEIEIVYSEDLSNYNTSILNINSTENINISNFSINPLFDFWIITGIGFDTIITKDFSNILYEKNDWTTEGNTNYMFYDFNELTNKLIQYTSGQSSGDIGLIYLQTLDANVTIESTDPNYVDRSYGDTVPVVYAGTPQF